MMRRRHAVRAGFISPYHRSGHDNALILISDRKISSLKDMLPLLDEVVKAGRPLLVVADSFAPSPSISRRGR